jgi:hypothetical protein
MIPLLVISRLAVLMAHSLLHRSRSQQEKFRFPSRSLYRSLRSTSI